jgi:flagellar motor switch/type III secretory pathway protein FliN
VGAAFPLNFSNLLIHRLAALLQDSGEMATANRLPTSVTEAARGIPPAADAVGASAGNALVKVPPSPDEDEDSAFGGPIARLPVELDVSVAVRGFRVRDLLTLEAGRLIESRWGSGIDVPLAAGGVELAQSEFEMVETRMAVRITRLA